MINILTLLCILIALVWLGRLAVMLALLAGRAGAVRGGDDGPPGDTLVSVLIPARNEAANIGACLESLLAQDYKNIEIVVADDRSTDDTARIVEALAATDPRLRLVRIGELPPGWTGKTHALHRAVAEARGEVLLFTDADTTHSPSNIGCVLARMRRKNLDMASLLTAMDTRSFWEHALQPVMGGMLISQFPLFLVNRKGGRLAFSNGQYIMIHREAYERLGGHAAVKDCLLEDMALARLAKRHGLNVEVIIGRRLTRVRMYSGFGEIWRGWSRIFYAALQGSLLKLASGILMLLALGIFPWACLGTGVALLVGGSEAAEEAVTSGLLLTALAGLTLTFQACTVGAFYRFVGCKVRYLVFFPLANVIGVAVLLNAARMSLSGKTVAWRGTEYACKNA